MSTFNNGEELESQLDKLQQRLNSFGEIQQSLKEVEGIGTAANGMIKVRVGPTGALSSVEIDPRAMRLGSETLAEKIMAAARDAGEEVSRRMNELLGGFTGGLTDVGEMFGAGGVSSAASAAAETVNRADPVKAASEAFEQARRRMYGH